jgi:hypothetical protein
MQFISCYNTKISATKNQMKFRALNWKSAEEFQDPLHKKLEFLRDRIFDDCPHVGKNGKNTSTKHTLCEEILNHVGDMNGKRVLVWFNPEFFFKIRDKYPDVEITLITGSIKAVSAGSFNKFGPNVTVILANPFDIEEIGRKIKKMNFNIVVGNPPYQSATAKQIKPWLNFLENSMDMATEYVAFITPDLWISGINKTAQKGRDLINRGHLTHVFLNLTETYFPTVGEKICGFVIDMGGSDILTEFIDDGRIVLKVPFIGDKIALDSESTTVLSIYDKMTDAKFENVKSKWLRLHANGSFLEDTTNFSVEPTDGFDTEIVLQHNSSAYTKVDYSKYFKPKIIFNNSGGYWSLTNSKYMMFKDTTRKVASNNAYMMLFDTQLEVENAITFFSSKLYLWFVKKFKTGGFNRMVVEQLPLLDCSRAWTDEELYDNFGLTKEERLHIDPSYKD